MNTTPRETVTDDVDSHNFDPCQATEELAHLVTRVEALAWATSQALGLPFVEADRDRSNGRLHALASLTAETAEQALDESDAVLARLNEYMRSRAGKEG